MARFARKCCWLRRRANRRIEHRDLPIRRNTDAGSGLRWPKNALSNFWRHMLRGFRSEQLLRERLETRHELLALQLQKGVGPILEGSQLSLNCFKIGVSEAEMGANLTNEVRSVEHAVLGLGTTALLEDELVERRCALKAGPLRRIRLRLGGFNRR